MPPPHPQTKEILLPHWQIIAIKEIIIKYLKMYDGSVFEIEKI